MIKCYNLFKYCVLDLLYPFGQEAGDMMELYAVDSCYPIYHSNFPMFGKRYSTIYVWLIFYSN